MPTLEIQTRRASFAPSSFDREAGTVRVVLSTGASVRRPGYVERLAIGPDNVNIAPRVPVLDTHRQTSITDIKGRVSDVQHEAGAIVATLHISDPAALDAIERGDVSGVSIGYRVTRWADSVDPATRERVRTATAWDLLEVSLVPVPADPSALIRSQPMTIQTTTEDPPVQTNRAEVCAQIRSVAEIAKLPATWADGQIDGGADVTMARAAAFEAMQTRTPPISTVQVGPSGDDPAVIQTRQTEALAARMTGTAPSDAARPYMNWGLADFARDALTRSGVTGVSAMGAETVMTRAMHTVSDFPGLLTGAGQRVLEPAYRAAESLLKQLARQRTATDFRPITMIRLGEFSALQKVTEAGEIKSITAGEASEGYSLETLAGLFNLSRKALINDDTNAFARWAEMMGQAAAQAESAQLVALLLESSGSGPVMGDGVRLFHADHGNLASPATVLSVASLSAARLAMRSQTGLDGVTPISVSPKFLLVAPDLETTAEGILASLSATTVADQNPFAGNRLTLLVDPYLPAGAWYVFADPAVHPVLEYAYLSSAQGPQLASRDGWDVLGREFRVVLDFGAGAVDYRGAYRNAGA